MDYELTSLPNGLSVILSPAPNTPRMALAVTIDGGVRRDTIPGIAPLASRLLVKGTESRDAETLARELDEHAIDLRENCLADCTLIAGAFLNRELPIALDLIRDMMFHSTFADFTKERDRLIGDIQSTFDFPAGVAQDLLTRNMFPDHPYGHSGSLILENAVNWTETSIRSWHFTGLDPSRMNVVLVGNFNRDEALALISDAFAGLSSPATGPQEPALEPLDADRFVTGVREDAQQAHVRQGWYAPPSGTVEEAQTAVMNIILGGAGLSSRLFRELRDKRGLAYAVRSSYSTMRLTGSFVVSIGTSPENINAALEGFDEQISRMKNEPISAEELEHAKGRLRGLYVLSTETNTQRCLSMAINHINGNGPNYSEVLLRRISEVTVDQVQAATGRIQAPSVTVVVARKDMLPQ